MKLIIALLLATSAALPAAQPAADLHPWESLSVQDSGRRKPIGTFGHEVLVKIAGRDPITLNNGTKVDGTEFAFAKFYATHDFSEEPIILISYRPLVERLGLEELGGMVRIGLVHYNTTAEVDRLIDALTALA